MLSLLINVTIAVVPVLAGLFVADTINLKQLQSTFLTHTRLLHRLPRPPPRNSRAESPRGFESGGKLIGPTIIPDIVTQRTPLPDVDIGAGIAGGVRVACPVALSAESSAE